MTPFKPDPSGPDSVDPKKAVARANFLSYGHDRNTRLVERIRVDLQEHSYDVWIDTSEIKSGDDWRRRIVDD